MEKQDDLTKLKEFKIQPRREAGYSLQPVSGFFAAVRSDGVIVLEPFCDLPPLSGAGSNADFVDRKVSVGLAMSISVLRSTHDLLGNLLKDLSKDSDGHD